MCENVLSSCERKGEEMSSDSTRIKTVTYYS